MILLYNYMILLYDCMILLYNIKIKLLQRVPKYLSLNLFFFNVYKL